MDIRLKQDLDHFFSVFQNNTLLDLHQLVPPTPGAMRYQAELEAEIKLLQTSVLNRVEEELSR